MQYSFYTENNYVNNISSVHNYKVGILVCDDQKKPLFLSSFDAFIRRILKKISNLCLFVCLFGKTQRRFQKEKKRVSLEKRGDKRTCQFKMSFAANLYMFI